MNTAKKYGIGTTIVMMFFLLIACGLLSSCKDMRPPQPPQTTGFKQIEIIEEGLIDGYWYKMFRDPVSKTRVFYYHGAMMMLPPEKVER